MSRSSNMLMRLQPFMRQSKVYKAIFDADGTQLETRDVTIADVRLQMSVDTATWGLAIYEADLGIVTDLSKSLADRRSVIKSRMRGTGKVDASLIKLVADSWTNGDVEVEFNGSIKIIFTSGYGIPEGLADLQEEISNIVPGHLSVIYDFSFLLIKEINEVMTLNELETVQLSKFAGGA